MFLFFILFRPSDVDHVVRYAGGLTLLVVYGHHVKSTDDTFLQLADECISLLANRIASGGGIWPVDIFPSRTSSLAGSEPAHVDTRIV